MIPISVADNIPEKVVMPMARRLPEPAPVAITIGVRPDLNSGYIFQADRASVGITANYNILKFFGCFETPLHIEFIIELPIAVFRSNRTGGGLNVLGGDCIGNILCGNSEFGHTQGGQPKTHGVFLHGKNIRG